MKRAIGSVVVALLALLVTGCNGGNTDTTYKVEIVPTDFVSTIDNEFLPLTPGTTKIYEGDTGDGLEHVEVLVTNETREILGVPCVVVRDTVAVNGQVVEDTFDWYAQDKDGNVWYFGEDVKDYKDGKVVSTAGSWEAGVDGAQPGIVMQAEPEVGEEYRQEYYRGEAEDMARVVGLDESVAVKAGAYQGCLKTYEWTPLDPEAKEYKYYAPGVGLVMETIAEDETKRIELVEARKS
ncbi:MAG: hypothetical protein V1748_10180 [Actinomycetota bacterium]